METQTKELQLIKIDPKEFGIEENKATLILKKFEPLQVKMQELEAEYQEVIAMEKSDPIAELKAKELGKKYMKIRTGRDAIHKEEKAFFLNAGRFVDRIKNDANKSTVDHEDKLEEIAQYHANIEAEKIKALAKSRQEILNEYECDGSTLNLGTMTDNIWVSFLSGTKMEFENKKALALKAEEEKIAKEKAEAEEQARIKAENEKLKAENEAKEKLRKVRSEELKPFIIFIRDYNGLLSASEDDYQKQFSEIKIGAQQHYEYENKKEQERHEKEIETNKELKLEREAKEKLEAELSAQKEKERIADETKKAEIKVKELAEAKLKKAPDKERLKKMIEDVMLVVSVSEFKTKDAEAMESLIVGKFNAFKTWANEQINTL